MTTAELVSVGEKGQIVIPKRIREDFNITKGVKLFVTEEEGKIILKPIVLDEKNVLMFLSETSLKKTWNNKYDARWDDVL